MHKVLDNIGVMKTLQTGLKTAELQHNDRIDNVDFRLHNTEDDVNKLKWYSVKTNLIFTGI